MDNIELNSYTNASGHKVSQDFTNAEDFVNTMAEQLRMAGLVQRDFLPRQLRDSESLRW